MSSGLSLGRKEHRLSRHSGRDRHSGVPIGIRLEHCPAPVRRGCSAAMSNGLRPVFGTVHAAYWSASLDTCDGRSRSGGKFMKRIACAALLAFVCASASAEWTLVGVDPTKARVYVDLETVRESKGLVRVSTLTDYPEARTSYIGEEFRSMTADEEYDCKSARVRYLGSRLYPANMANGVLVAFAKTATDWKNVPSGTLVEDTMKIACSNPQAKYSSPQTPLPVLIK
jgi:hypothetical protein